VDHAWGSIVDLDGQVSQSGIHLGVGLHLAERTPVPANPSCRKADDEENYDALRQCLQCAARRQVIDEH
jgi:hypothetical protein